MNQTALAVLVAVGGLALIFLVVLGAMATYDTMAGGGSMDQMWDMMDDMGGMMDGGMGDMMDGMMRGRSGPETAGTATGRGEVRIVDFRFEPTVLNVTPGTVVTWTNEDSAPHTATGDGDFDTGRLDKGESGEVQFDQPGAFEYICTYHPWMEGQVVVAEGG
ncbi:MAG: cupredoxin domain-containing protein [Chloroflexi bacterium]|nr:cupredoxin domain-containing protein [Chloroflexota bacterium]